MSDKSKRKKEQEFDLNLPDPGEKLKQVVEKPINPVKSMSLTRCDDIRVDNSVVYRNGEDYYSVPVDMATGKEISVTLDDTRIILMYNWETEINDALPDIKTIRDNIRNALWRNGAVTKDAARESRVRRNLTKGAFPYRIEI